MVDEDSDLRRLYAEALAGLGYSVDAAEDGAAGWEALKANRYGLLITEHEIPVLTGVELVKSFDLRPRWRNLLSLMRCWTP